jgi:hypothetical protein
VIVVDRASFNCPPELAKDYLYGRTGHSVFGTEDSRRKSLGGLQKLWDFYCNQTGGGDCEGDQ